MKSNNPNDVKWEALLKARTWFNQRIYTRYPNETPIERLFNRYHKHPLGNELETCFEYLEQDDDC